MLTQNDIAEIERIVDEKLDEKIKPLPTKDVFYERMDQLLAEVRAMRDEFALHAGSHDNLTEKDEELDKRLEIVEKKLHVVTTA